MSKKQKLLKSVKDSFDLKSPITWKDYWIDEFFFSLWLKKQLVELGVEKETQTTLERYKKDQPHSPQNSFLKKKKIKQKKKPLHHPNAKLVEYKGQKCTFQELSRMFDIPISTLRRRYREGMRPPRLLKPVDNSSPLKAKKYEVFGESKTLYQWQKDPRCEVNQVTLQRRLDQGMSIEEAVTTPKKCIGIAKRITIDGKTQSIKEWSKDKRCKVSYSTLKDRIKKGMDSKKALITPPRVSKN